MPGNNEFVVRYTNKDIMDKLNAIEGKLESGKGKISFNRKLILASFGYITLVVGWLFSMKR